MKPIRDGYGEGLVKLGKVNKNVVVLDAGVSDSTRTEWFKKEFPERFFNMGISEADMVCAAAGMSTCGKVAFATSFAGFLLGRTMDQIFVSVAYSKTNVKLAGSHAGVSVGEDGPTAQSINDIAMMRAMPNMVVVVPADAKEAEKAVFALAEHKGPAYIRLARSDSEEFFGDNYEFKIGKATVMKKGKNAVIIAIGVMVKEAMAAAEILEADGLDVGVVNMSTIKPLDREAIIKAAETGVVITAEDHNIIGGLGSAVAEVLAEEKLDVAFKRIGAQDRFAESGPAKELFEKYGLNGKHIAAAVKAVAKK
ncbi:transketolase family protein [Candidatus Woesearchaeota archaeon]|nr:transketolase family protein [Candidatus Woesearchaeota archaeon]